MENPYIEFSMPALNDIVFYDEFLDNSLPNSREKFLADIYVEQVACYQDKFGLAKTQMTFFDIVLPQITPYYKWLYDRGLTEFSTEKALIKELYRITNNLANIPDNIFLEFNPMPDSASRTPEKLLGKKEVRKLLHYYKKVNKKLAIKL